MVEDVIRIPSLSFASIQTLGIPAADDCFLSILLEPQSRKGEKPLSKPKVRCFADPRYGAGSAPPLQAPRERPQRLRSTDHRTGGGDMKPRASRRWRVISVRRRPAGPEAKTDPFMGTEVMKG
jgi:hypothetical protein